MEQRWAWDGTIPEGWVPVRERLAVLRAQRAEAEAARGSPPEAQAA